MGAINGVDLTSAAINGIELTNGFRNGLPIFGNASNPEYTLEIANIVFEVTRSGIVTLTIGVGTITSSTYEDGEDIGGTTNDRTRSNAVVVEIPGGYSNSGSITFNVSTVQLGAGIPTVVSNPITGAPSGTSIYEAMFSADITDTGGLDIEEVGFWVLAENTNSIEFIINNGGRFTTTLQGDSFDFTLLSTQSETTYSVVAFATNSLGQGTSTVRHFTTTELLTGYNRNNWISSGGGVTINRAGDVTVAPGNAASTRNFPTNVGSHDTCDPVSVTVNGQVEVPEGFLNTGNFVDVFYVAQRQSALSRFGITSWNGTVEIDNLGATTVTNGNASNVVVVSVVPSGPNINLDPRLVVVTLTVTAGTGFCNSGDTFDYFRQIAQPPADILSTLEITPTSRTVASTVTSITASYVVTSMDGGQSISRITDLPISPAWISDSINTVQGNIVFTLLQNTTNEDRAIELVYQTGDGMGTASITITQSAPEDNEATIGVINNGMDITVSGATTTVSIPISANGDWTLDETVNRWTPNRLSGSGNTTVQFDGRVNMLDEITGTITLVSTNGLTLDTINFTQLSEGNQQ